MRSSCVWLCQSPHSPFGVGASGVWREEDELGVEGVLVFHLPACPYVGFSSMFRFRHVLFVLDRSGFGSVESVVENMFICARQGTASSHEARTHKQISESEF